MEYSQTYSKYKTARDLSWAVLIKHKLVHFPIDIIQLIQKHDIALINRADAPNTVATYNISPTTDAIALCIKGKYFIIYNPNNDPKRRLFTLAHELGHILLNHVTDAHAPYNDYQENEANIFASRLLMPAIVCHEEQLHTAEQISKHFGVSIESAKIRAERIAELEKRNKWLLSPLEQEYLTLYKNTTK